MCLVAHVKIITVTGIKRHRLVLFTNVITDLVKSKEVIVRKILEVFREYDFDEEEVKKYVTFVTDRGGNLKFGLRSSGYERHSCYAHLVHNLVTAMLRFQDMDGTVKAASKLASYMKDRGLNGKLKTSLKTYTSTRWNSTFMMLNSILENYEGIIEVLNEKQRATKIGPKNLVDMVTCISKNTLNKVCDFLKPFKMITDQIEADKKDTIHLVWPVFLQLRELLVEDIFAADDDDDAIALIEHMKSIGRRYMQVNQEDFEPTLRHKHAVMLNPIMKKMPIVDFVERQTIYSEIESTVDEMIRKEAQENPTTQSTTQTITLISTSTLNEVQRAVPSFLQSFMQFDQPIEPAELSEVQKYLQVQVTPTVTFDPNDWWWENRNVFPHLFKIYVRISSIPATSASSERDFSLAGLIINDRRSVILPANVNNLIVARNSI